MLPRQHRLTRRTEFTEVVRRGRRAARPLLSLHADLSGRDSDRGAGGADGGSGGVPAGRTAPVRAGLVVSRAVGSSVVRSRVARRLRHLLRDRLDRCPPGARLVVRAAPPAARADSAALAEDLDALLNEVLRPRRSGRART